MNYAGKNEINSQPQEPVGQTSSNISQESVMGTYIARVEKATKDLEETKMGLEMTKNKVSEINTILVAGVAVLLVMVASIIVMLGIAVIQAWNGKEASYDDLLKAIYENNDRQAVQFQTESPRY